MMTRMAMTTAAAVFALSSGLGGAVLAQTGAVPVVSSPVETGQAQAGSPQRATLVKMMRPVAIEFTETRLEDAMRYITEITQTDTEIFWADDRSVTGLDKETPITLKSERVTALALLDKVLEKAGTDTIGTGGNTWQLSESGTLQIGPKERLNRFKRVEIYNVMDLMSEVPDYGDAPQFNLQAVLQATAQRGGGGGGQSPFTQQNNTQDGLGTRTPAERLQELTDLLTQLVEPEQWVDNGGDGASMRPFQGNLIVSAPDYIHRGLNGYSYWPAAGTRMASVKGRRYVTLGVDTSIAKLVGFENVPVSAVTGSGAIVSSDDNSGPPGGKQGPAKKEKK